MTTNSAGSAAAAPHPARPSHWPDFSRATILDGKIAGYALKMDHPKGGGKARVIKSATGLGPEDADNVKQQIWAKANQTGPNTKGRNRWGQVWAVDIDLEGPKGSVRVRTGWMTEDNGVTRLTTVSFPPKGRQ
ncbi:DUF6883 domain-containing protein [Natronoglycomyces albus]|uniref:DUF6883 domain-containing protein n=1 Tax=Natronoglycomyces albus TaxID=2811108 RepID=UPI003CCD0EB5